MTLDTTPFEFAADIETKEDMALYLSIFLEENGIEGLTQALQFLAKEKGIVYVFDSAPGKGLIIFEKGEDLLKDVQAKLGVSL